MRNLNGKNDNRSSIDFSVTEEGELPGGQNMTVTKGEATDSLVFHLKSIFPSRFVIYLLID